MCSEIRHEKMREYCERGCHDFNFKHLPKGGMPTYRFEVDEDSAQALRPYPAPAGATQEAKLPKWNAKSKSFLIGKDWKSYRKSVLYSNDKVYMAPQGVKSGLRRGFPLADVQKRIVMKVIQSGKTQSDTLTIAPQDNVPAMGLLKGSLRFTLPITFKYHALTTHLPFFRTNLNQNDKDVTTDCLGFVALFLRRPDRIWKQIEPHTTDVRVTHEVPDLHLGLVSRPPSPGAAGEAGVALRDEPPLKILGGVMYGYFFGADPEQVSVSRAHAWGMTWQKPDAEDLNSLHDDAPAYRVAMMPLGPVVGTKASLPKKMRATVEMQARMETDTGLRIIDGRKEKGQRPFEIHIAGPPRIEVGPAPAEGAEDRRVAQDVRVRVRGAGARCTKGNGGVGAGVFVRTETNLWSCRMVYVKDDGGHDTRIRMVVLVAHTHTHGKSFARRAHMRT